MRRVHAPAIALFVATLLAAPTTAVLGSDDATATIQRGPIDTVQWTEPSTSDFAPGHAPPGAWCPLTESVMAAPDALAAAATVAPAVETGSVQNDADDPAIWIHPSDPAQSLVIGTDKGAGVFSWDLAGQQVQFMSGSQTGNVDVRYNFRLGSSQVDIAAATNRSTDRIDVYKINPSTRNMENIAGTGIGTNLSPIYGFCLYHSPVSGKFYAFANDKSGQVEQYELIDEGTTVDGVRVRSFAVGSQTEGCVADDELATFYIGEEGRGIWRYGAEPGDGSSRTLVDGTTAGHLTADVEGLTIYYGPGGSGYLIASSQGDSTFAVYDRQAPNAYRLSFQIGQGNGIDAVTSTDGIDVSNVGLGATFANGLFVVHDGTNDKGANNFKLVRWSDIASLASPPLAIDTRSYNPRQGSTSPPAPATTLPPTTAPPTSIPPSATTTRPTATSTSRPPGGPTQPPVAPPPAGGSTAGIWISPAELAGLPTSGPAWNQVKSVADQPAGRPELNNQDDDTNVNVMAKALVFARTGDVRYRNDVLEALRIITFENTESGGRTLALGRELAAYVISADLIGLKNVDPALDGQFRNKLRELLSENLSGRTLRSTHEGRANNWGTHSGASRAAVAVYLGDRAELERTAQVFKGWLGDRTSYAGFDFGDLSWQCDSSRPVGVNTMGCVKDGHSIDGALPEEMRRGGGFHWPPARTNYAWGGMQGAVAQAHILYRAGYPAWEWENRALLRAAQFLYGIGWQPSGDDEWQPWLVNYAYGSSFAAVSPANPGKNVGWSDWTHAQRSGAPATSAPQPSATATSRPPQLPTSTATQPSSPTQRPTATSTSPAAPTQRPTATSTSPAAPTQRPTSTATSPGQPSATATNVPPTPTSASAPTPQPQGPAGFNARQIPVELQAWWMPNFGHIHAAVKLPIGQQVSGSLPVEVRIVLHDNPSHLFKLRFDNESGGLVGDVALDGRCPFNGPGTASTNCSWSVPVTLDTRRLGGNGWHTLRVRATVDTPDGRRWTTSSDIPLCVGTGACGGAMPDLTGKGWYETIGYTNVRIRSDTIPTAPVRGVYTFYVRAHKEPSSHLQVAMDKSHYIPPVGSWKEEPPSAGQLLYDRDGNYQSWVPVAIDTRTLANGWHSFAVRSTSLQTDKSTCSYCRGEDNHAEGVAKIWFYVDN